MTERRKKALRYVCRQYFTLRFMFYAGTAALLLDLVALATLEPGNDSRVVAIINLPGVLFFLLFSGYFLWKCSRA